MKIAVLLALTVAVTLVNGASLEKRDFGDVINDFTAAGQGALSELIDLAGKGWKNLQQRLKDYDISSRFDAIRQKVMDRYGDVFDRISNFKFQIIVLTARNMIEDARDVLQVDRIVEKIRSALGAVVDDVRDDQISNIVQGVQEDATSGDDDNDDGGMRKRGLRDDLRGFFRNLTSIGRDAFSDLLSIARRGWGNLRQRIRDYDIRGRLAAIRQRVRNRYGDVIDSVTGLRLEHIVTAARDVIEDARDVLEVDTIVQRIRTSLGSDVDDVSDDQLADIVQGLEDDVADSDDDDDDDDDDDGGLGKRGLRDDLRSVVRNITSAGRDLFSDLFDLAGRGWNNLRQRIRDYDIRGRVGEIRQRVRNRYGDVIDRITNLRFEHIVKAARDVIEDARDVLQVDRVVDGIRKALGSDLDDVSDDQLADIVQGLEDDAVFDPLLDDVDRDVDVDASSGF